MDFKDAAEFAVDYALKKGAEYVDVRAESSSFKSFSMQNGILNGVSSGNDTGIGVRILKGSLGFFSTNKLNKKNIKELVEKTIRNVERVRLHHRIEFSSEKTYKKNYKVDEKIKISDLSLNEKIKFLKDIEAHTKQHAISRYFSLSEQKTKKIVMTSEGSRITSEIPRLSFYYMLTIKAKNDYAQHFWQFGMSSGYEAFKKWNLCEELKNTATALKKNLEYGKKVKPQIMDVVVAPQVTGIIVHESCGHPYEADRILGREAAQAGESFVKPGMLKSLLGSVVVNIVDDPTLKNSFGFYLFDDEGVKARRKFLMKNGRINEFLHNRETSFLMGLKNNGSARSTSYEFEPIVRMSNTFMLPGDYKEEELIENVKFGVYIKNFMEWNIDDKRLNQKYVGAEAYFIKNGEIKEPVRNPIIEITTPELYKSVDAVADNLEFHAGTCGKGEPMQGIPVWFGGPSFRMRKIFVR